MTKADGPLTPEARDALRAQAEGCHRRPGLAVICLGVLPNWVGEDCAACGIYCERYALPLGMGLTDLRDLVEELNLRTDLDGILIWLARPEGWDSQGLSGVVSPDKQADAPTWAETLELTIARVEKRT